MTDKRANNTDDRFLHCAAAEGCADSRLLLSRRAMLGVTAGLFSWAYMPRLASAASTDPRLLIVVLRGGLDGINTVVPIGDPHYASMRGRLAIPAASALPLDGFFRLHPAMKNFRRLYASREAAVVHATCVPLRNRSHFDAQDNLETGLPGMSAANSTGWLNRLLTTLPAGEPVKLRKVIEIGDSPLILRGPAPVLGWSPTMFQAVGDPALGRVQSLYQALDPAMHGALTRGLEAHRLATRVGGADDQVSLLRKGFRGAGRLIGADNGPRIAVLSVDGWDTHSDQGGTVGQLANLMTELDAAIDDFKACVGAPWKDTVMVLASEFGRTVRTNGDRGTDHGVGTVALLAGGAVNGGHVFGDWPGLAPKNLYEGSDLTPTTDLRAVFKGVLKDHIGVPASLLNTTIFPGSANTAPLQNLVKRTAAAQTAAAANARPTLRVESAIARYRRGQGPA